LFFREVSSAAKSILVMAGLVPAIHVLSFPRKRESSNPWRKVTNKVGDYWIARSSRAMTKKTWMPGTRPGMTISLTNITPATNG
jgi:hypothetical protein